MTRFLGRRIAVAFLLAVFLVAPWAAAEPRDDRGAASPQLLAQLWSWLSTLWSEEGCMLDPDGRCGGAPAPAHLDEGCMLDPSGGCRETPSPPYQQEGCMIDPSGRCGGAPAPAHLDEGCIIDPNGGCRH